MVRRSGPGTSSRYIIEGPKRSGPRGKVDCTDINQQVPQGSGNSRDGNQRTPHSRVVPEAADERSLRLGSSRAGLRRSGITGKGHT